MEKIYNIQNKIKAIKKDETNPFYHSQFFDINGLLEVLKPLLNEESLIVMQPLSHIEGKPALRTVVIDATDGKELVNDITPLTENSDPQKMGAVITYFRRYALQSLFLLQSIDNDAEEAVDHNSMTTPIKITLPKTVKPTYEPNSKEVLLWIDIPYSKENVAMIKTLEWAGWKDDRKQWRCADTPENREKLKNMKMIKTIHDNQGNEITL